MKKIILLILCLISVHAIAQEGKTVYFSLLQPCQLNTNRQFKKLLKKNNVSRDSVTQYINGVIEKSLHTGMPDMKLLMVDTSLLLQVFDSSKVVEMLTSTQLQKVNNSKGLKKLSNFNSNQPDSRYRGRYIHPAGSDQAKMNMQANHVDYFLLINELEMKNPGKYGLVLHYEIYDKDFNRIYGDKYMHSLDFSSKMYYSTFLFYMRYCMEGFGKQITSKKIL